MASELGAQIELRPRTLPLSAAPLVIAYVIGVPCLYALTGRGFFLSPDPYYYGEAAQLWLRGLRLYSEIWLDKPPVVPLFYMVPELFVAGSLLALQVWLGIWIVLESGMAVLAFGRGTSPFQLAITFAILSLVPLTYAEWVWISSEHLSNLFLTFLLFASYRVLSADPLTRPLLITAGLCTAFTFQSRQNTLLGGAVLALAILMSSQSLRRKLLDLAWVALGFGLGLAVLLMIVATWGDLRGYFYVVFVYPKNYAKATYQTLPQMIYSFGMLFKFLWEQVFGLILVILCCLLRFDKTFKKRRIPLFLAAATLSGIFICLAPLKPYSHYWASLVPFVALLTFAYLDERQSAPSRTGKLICAACAGYLVSLSLLSASYFAIANYTRGMRANLDKVVEKVNSTAGKNDTLLVLGEQIEAAYVCYRTRCLPANSVFSSMQMEPYWSEILPKKFDVVFDEYLKAPPSIIVVGRHLSEGRPEVANQIRLLAALQKRWCYREDFSINKYKIFVKCN